MTLVAVMAISFLLMFSVVAMADTLTWTWTPPDAREDGTPLPADEIAGYGMMINGAVITETNVLGETVPLLLDDGSNAMDYVADLGEQCAQFNTVDTEGRESVFTDPSCKVAKGLPGKPVSVNVTIVRPKRN